MPGGLVAPGRLDEGLIVPDANAIYARQVGCQLAQAWIKHELAHSCMILPEIDTLNEYSGVIVVPGKHTAVRQHAVTARGDRFVYCLTPFCKFIGRQQIVQDNKAVCT